MKERRYALESLDPVDQASEESPLPGWALSTDRYIPIETFVIGESLAQIPNFQNPYRLLHCKLTTGLLE